jgi:hypothetical protein
MIRSALMTASGQKTTARMVEMIASTTTTMNWMKMSTM